MKRPLIKICGLTSAHEAESLAGLGANLLGFIFHEASPRRVEAGVVRAINHPQARKVGVFVRQSLAEVSDLMQTARLSLAQLHGDQSPEFCQALGPERVIKVLWPTRYENMADLAQEMEKFAPHVTYFLLDAGASGGGHGHTFDWSGLARLNPPKPYFLAGGLDPDNCLEPLRGQYNNLAGLDFNSGLEISPGRKDLAKAEKMFNNIAAFSAGK